MVDNGVGELMADLDTLLLRDDVRALLPKVLAGRFAADDEIQTVAEPLLDMKGVGDGAAADILFKLFVLIEREESNGKDTRFDCRNGR